MSPDFESYLASLSKSARHNYRAAMRENEGRRHEQIDYHPFLVRAFMALWERQEVDGKCPKWVFGPEYFDRQNAAGNLRLFVVLPGPIGLHVVEQHGCYVYAHPPCYDKANHPELARFMWFSLMRWACENDIEYVDLGGGANGTWRDCAMSRPQGVFAYKWRYVPKAVKEHPEQEPPFVQMRCDCGHKQISIVPIPCERCGSNLDGSKKCRNY